METVVIAASRDSFALSGTTLMVLSIVAAVLVIAVFTGLKHFRNRHVRRA